MTKQVAYEALEECRFQPIFGSGYVGQESFVTVDELIAWLGEFPPLNSTVLDAGCGKGAFACLLAKQANVRVVGIDADASSVKRARARARQLEVEKLTTFEAMDLNCFARMENRYTFDFVYALDVLQYCDDLQECCKLLLNCLRKQGIFLATIWCFEESLMNLAESWGMRRVYDWQCVNEMLNEFNLGQSSIFVNERFVQRC